MAISKNNLYGNGKGNIWSGTKDIMMSFALILDSVHPWKYARLPTKI